MNPSPVIKLKDACKSYEGRTVLYPLTLDIRSGETVAVVGTNGSGKSTLLKILAGLSRLTGGSRTVGTSGGKAARFGFAPDRFPKLRFTAIEYLSHRAAISGMEKKSAGQRIERLLQDFGLDSYAELQIRHFSKGMLQKINVIQAALGEPDLLLLDEPFSGLDVETQADLYGKLARLREDGTAIVITGHENDWLPRLATRILSLKEGRLLDDRQAAVESAPLCAVECRVPESAAETVMALLNRPELPGMVSYSLSGGKLACRIESARCDGWLLRLLSGGASVVSVARTYGEEPQDGQRRDGR